MSIAVERDRDRQAVFGRCFLLIICRKHEFSSGGMNFSMRRKLWDEVIVVEYFRKPSDLVCGENMASQGNHIVQKNFEPKTFFAITGKACCDKKTGPTWCWTWELRNKHSFIGQYFVLFITEWCCECLEEYVYIYMYICKKVYWYEFYQRCFAYACVCVEIYIYIFFFTRKVLSSW